ncbi:Copia protein, partial [Mucuna pruriens]
MAGIETIRLVVATAIRVGVTGHGKVYKLKKALYRLKQAPWAWNRRIDCFLLQLDFNKCTTEYEVYVRATADDLMFACLYVDDLLVIRSNTTSIDEFKRRIMLEFEMIVLGLLSYFLGMEFVTTSEGIFMHQKRYATEVLKRLHMLDCNSAQTPVDCGIKLEKNKSDRSIDATLYKQIVGSLRFLCRIRPNIAYGVGLISRFMNHLRLSHLLSAKRILRYMKGTLDYGLLFSKHGRSVSDEIHGYRDFDQCGDKKVTSTIGYVFIMCGAPISLCSKKQLVVALSPCEAEYVAASMGACQALWLENVMTEMKIRREEPMKILIDNKSAISLAKHFIAHGRSKHIGTKFHFLRDQVSKGKLELKHCSTNKQVADILTKPLKGNQFKMARDRIGVQPITNLN